MHSLPEKSWLDPTPEMLADPTFNAIWNVIKTWDVNVPEVYAGYCGATGNHARAIFDAVCSVNTPSKGAIQQIDDVTAIAAGDGNCNYNEYMMGMANGLILAQHIVHERHDEVPYKSKPDVWLKDVPRESTTIIDDAVPSGEAK